MNGQWRTAWITGASHGIGRSLALRLAGTHAVKVAASARGETALQSLREDNGLIVPYVLDVTDTAAVEACIARMEAELGLPDLVVLNAGIYEPAAAAETTAAQYRDHMTVNYIGVTNCVAAILPRLLARGAGQLAIVGSVAGYRGLPGSAAYGPTKAALASLAETLRLELQGSGVDIRLVSPGFVATRLTEKNRFPMPAIIDTDEAAARIVDGLEGRRFETAFPWRFVAWLKLARILPWGLYQGLVRRVTRQ